ESPYSPNSHPNCLFSSCSASDAMAAVGLLGVRPAPATGRLERQARASPDAVSWGWRARARPLRSVPPPGRAGRGGARAARPLRAAMGGGDLYALDFDGVFCDSCGESSLSAVKAAKVRWPWAFEQVDAAMEEWIVEQMHTLRPVIETGYENLLLVRLLVEIQIPSARKSSVADGLSIQEILDNWSKLLPTLMDEWQEDRESLVDLFGRVRDDWLENDLSGWIGANRFYPGTADALKLSSSELYIVTTKQSRFTGALLKELAGVDFPSERIYGLGTGPKVKVLQQLQEMPQHQGLTLHFVEDRLATLKNVIKEPALDKWNLYLGKSWC
uniref:Uncharacterized protein n=1 Tax=Aegilops tauschii subsp. strangulata TaxID=200361 RepID=A0A453QI21_AEGTS